MSTFTELTSVSSSDYIPSTQSKEINRFQQVAQELDFIESPQREIPSATLDFAISDTSNSSDESLSESSESEDDEDLDPTYEYKKEKKFRGLEDRIKARLATDDTEIDKEFEELEELAKVTKRKLLQPGTKFIPGSIFTCVMCAKPFSTAEKLQEHTNQAHQRSENKHKCEICEKSYKHKKNLKSHMTIHTKEFQCSNCAEVFQSAATLQSHVVKLHKTLAEESKIVMKECDRCKGQFPEEAFVRHVWYCKKKEKKNTSGLILSHPSASVRDKSCQVCGETFASRQSMIRHVGRKHPEMKNDSTITEIRYVSTESSSHAYACQDCGKRLTTRSALTQHRARAHLDSTRYQCHLCQKSYTLPSELKKHIKRVHESSKPVRRGPLPDLDDICEF